MQRPPRRRVLLVEHDVALAQATLEALRAAGMEAVIAHDAQSALRIMGASEPDVLLVELELPGKDGLWLLRRLRDDFMGQKPRAVLIAPGEAIGARVADLGADAVILKPATPPVLAQVAAAEVDTQDPTRMRELVTLSLLTGEMEGMLVTAAKRLALTFRTSECIVVGSLGERQWVGVARGLPAGQSDEPVWAHSAVALVAGAPVLAQGASGRVETFLAFPFDGGGTRVGFMLLLDEKARLFSADIVDSLRALAGRLYGELSWRSVHERISADRDRLRESSMLDPMLPGVWTRAALDQALGGEVAACQRRGEPMTVAIVDLRGLRHLNERLGHVAGDAALRQMATIVRQTVRTQDLCARFAGDAMALVLAGTSVDDAMRASQRIIAAIEAAPLLHGGQEISLAVTIGLAGLAGDDDTGEAALGRASSAMKAAKRRREPVLIADAALADEVAAFGVPAAGGLEAGTTLGGMYQILHEISRGAMGVVYRAEDLGLGRPVALKTLRPDLARDRNFVERFRTEAATLAALRHENLVQVYAFGADGDDVYFVMELVEGEPLEDRIELARHEGRLMPFDEVERVISQIAEALDCMHRAGIFHRDVKPANVLLDRVRERAVLVDVGIAKRRGSETDPAGTPGFTAPESFTGAAESAASDVYGLAATAYTLLATAAPFGGGTVEEILKRQQAQLPNAPSALRPALPAAVDAVFAAALDPRPSARPQGASDFARRLAQALSGARPDVRAGKDRVQAPPPPDGKPDGEADADGTTAVNPLNANPAADDSQHDTLTRAMVARASAEMPVARLAAQSAAVPSLREPEAPSASVPHTRGVLFRSAYRVLGARHGAAWVSSVSRTYPALAQALQPQTTLLSWHPTEQFVTMLEAIGTSGRDARAFARELGKVATAATFSRFFGANPAALSPWQVLSAADLFWRRYHTWGVVGVERSGELAAKISIGRGPKEPLVCVCSAGILEQVANLAGASAATVEETACESTGADACTFLIRWQPRK